MTATLPRTLPCFVLAAALSLTATAAFAQRSRTAWW